MLELCNGEINDYQLKMINQWTSDEISTFKSKYEKLSSKNSKEAKECLNTIYEYRLLFKETSDLNITKLHNKGIDKFHINLSKNRKIEELIKTHNELILEKELKNNAKENDNKIIQRVNNIKQLYKKYLNKDIKEENITEDLKSKDDNLIYIAMDTIKNTKDIILTFKELKLTKRKT